MPEQFIVLSQLAIPPDRNDSADLYGHMNMLSIDRMVTHIQENNFSFFLVEKLKQNSVLSIYTKTPLFLELAVESMGIEPRIESTGSKYLDALIYQMT